MPPSGLIAVKVLFVTVSGPLCSSIAPPLLPELFAEAAVGDRRLALVVVDGAAVAGAAGCHVAGERAAV